MKPKHTPGPWSVRNKFGRQEVISNAKGNEATNGYFVADCMVSSAYRTEGETLANATLIAAAPDLKYALETARDVILALNGRIDYSEEIDIIDKALAKTEGK